MADSGVYVEYVKISTYECQKQDIISEKHPLNEIKIS